MATYLFQLYSFTISTTKVFRLAAFLHLDSLTSVYARISIVEVEGCEHHRRRRGMHQGVGNVSSMGNVMRPEVEPDDSANVVSYHLEHLHRIFDLQVILYNVLTINKLAKIDYWIQRTKRIQWTRTSRLCIFPLQYPEILRGPFGRLP